MAEEKTNVMRMLEQAGVPYAAHGYPHGKEPVDGVTVAGILGRDPQQVFKTLVTRGASGGFCVFVIPADGTLDLKKAARAAGETPCRWAIWTSASMRSFMKAAAAVP